MTVLRLATSLVIAASLSACSINQTIELQDSEAFAQSAIMRYAPGGPGTRVNIEVGFDRVEAEQDLTLDSGQIRWAGQNFNGPVDLDTSWTQESAFFGAAFQLLPETYKDTSFFLSVGLRRNQVELEINDVEDRFHETSIYGSLDFNYRFPRSPLGIFVRGLLASNQPLEGISASDENENELLERQIELGFSAGLRPISIRAGWRSTDTRVDIDGASDLDLEASGPFIGLTTQF